MLKNYLLIALRNLQRDRVTAGINILGLTIGIACFLLIALYIQYELSYDQQHEKSERIYRVAQQQEGNFFRGTDRFTGTPSVLAPTLRNEFPEVETATTLQLYQMPLELDHNVVLEAGLFTDEYLFDVFSYKLLEGRLTLKSPDDIILTRSLARKLFGSEDALGKTILIQNEHVVTVTGMIEDVPKNQHFSFSFITSFRNLPFYEENRWNSNNFITYVVLPKGYDFHELDDKLTVLKKYTAESYAELPFKPKFFLQPLTDIHLYSNLNFELSETGTIGKVWLFASLAFIILTLASINYMNLAIARSSMRGKEIGMRKVFGAQKIQLVYQYLGESILLTAISFVLAMALVNLVLPLVNELAEEDIHLDLTSSQPFLLAMLLLPILVGGLSGVYPATLLSAMRPMNILKGVWTQENRKGIGFRNTLVVVQFCASIVLATGTVVIYRQFQFIQTKELGYNRERIVYVPFVDIDLTDRLPTLRHELMKNPQVEKVSFLTEMPLNMYSETTINNWEGNTEKSNLFIYRSYVDYDFLDLFEIKLLEGRNFSPDHPTDSLNGYLLNESAVRALGWKSPIGKQFLEGQVIGVVKDFHFQSFDLTIQPMFIRFRTKENKGQLQVAMKIKMDEPAKTVEYVNGVLKSLVPHVPIECRFMESDYNLIYRSQTRFGNLFNIFTALALFIACMGMFGLVSQTVFKRTKEIGIRKVLGATAARIVGLLSIDFLKPVLLSAVIALPIAWWIMDQWLQEFAYRIRIEWWMFLVSGLAAVIIALLTISIQAIKAAVANPADSLRSE